MSEDIGGVWRTIGGRRVFIRNGVDLKTAMIESGKFKFDKTKIKEDVVKNKVIDITDEEVEEDFFRGNYKYRTEFAPEDKDLTFEQYKEKWLSHEGNRNYYKENFEAFKQQYIRRKENENRTFGELTDREKGQRYKDAALKYTCGDYKDIINYQLGKNTRGNVEEIKKTTIALEYLSNQQGFNSQMPYYRGLQNVSAKGLKKGDIIAMRPTISSWTDDIEVAKKFSTDKKDSLIIVNKNGKYGDINYYNSIRKEGEVIMSGTRNEFKIIDIKKEGNITYLYTDQSFYKD